MLVVAVHVGELGPGDRVRVDAVDGDAALAPRDRVGPGLEQRRRRPSRSATRAALPRERPVEVGVDRATGGWRARLSNGQRSRHGSPVGRSGHAHAPVRDHAPQLADPGRGRARAAGGCYRRLGAPGQHVRAEAAIDDRRDVDRAQQPVEELAVVARARRRAARAGRGVRAARKRAQVARVRAAERPRPRRAGSRARWRPGAASPARNARSDAGRA